MILLSKIFIASEIYENAIATLNEAILRQPSRHEPYELFAAVYDKLGEKEKADKMYRKAAKLAK